MSIFTQTSSQQIWLTHYHLNSLESTSLSRTAYLLCLAENTEDYTKKVNTYLAQTQLHGQAQLAPLPIQTWLTRHGFEAKLWQAAQQCIETAYAETAAVVCVYTQGMEGNEQSSESFLVQHSIHFTPFTEAIVSDVLPEPVRSTFFAEFDGLGEYHKIRSQAAYQREKEEEKHTENQKAKYSLNRPHFYAVVDCAKAVSFPSRLQSAGRLESLYTGNIGQTLEDHAPYLLEFDPYQQETVAFLQRLFRKSESKVFSHWAINPVIFIKSLKPFEDVYRHLRKWTHLYDSNNEKWYFFRFYDPLVLNRYLPQLAHYPAQLAALFGAKPNAQGTQDKPIIEAFGLRVDNEFITFTLNSLPENTMPAKIELGEVEKKINNNSNWQQMKAKLVQEAESYFPEVDAVQLKAWLDEGKTQKIAQTAQGYWFYLCGRIMALENHWDYFAVLTTFQEKTEHSGDELLEVVMKYMMEKDGE